MLFPRFSLIKKIKRETKTDYHPYHYQGGEVFFCNTEIVARVLPQFCRTTPSTYSFLSRKKQILGNIFGLISVWSMFRGIPSFAWNETNLFIKFFSHLEKIFLEFYSLNVFFKKFFKISEDSFPFLDLKDYHTIFLYFEEFPYFFWNDYLILRRDLCRFHCITWLFFVR